MVQYLIKKEEEKKPGSGWVYFEHWLHLREMMLLATYMTYMCFMPSTCRPNGIQAVGHRYMTTFMTSYLYNDFDVFGCYCIINNYLRASLGI